MFLPLTETEATLPQKWHRWAIAWLLFLTGVAFLILWVAFKQNPAPLFIAASISVALGLVLMFVTLRKSFKKSIEGKINVKKTLIRLLYIKDFILFGLFYAALCFYGASFAVLLGYGPAALINTFGHWYTLGSWLRSLILTDPILSAIVMGVIAIGMFMAYFIHFMECKIPQKGANLGDPKEITLFIKSIRNYPRIVDSVFCGLAVLLLVGFILSFAMNAAFTAAACPMLFIGVELLFVVKLVGEARFFRVFRGTPYALTRTRFVGLAFGIGISSALAVLGLLVPGWGQIGTLISGSLFACVMLSVGVVQCYGSIKNHWLNKTVEEFAIVTTDTQKTDDTDKNNDTLTHTNQNNAEKGKIEVDKGKHDEFVVYYKKSSNATNTNHLLPKPHDPNTTVDDDNDGIKDVDNQTVDEQSNTSPVIT